MQALERRIAALEQASPEGIKIIFIILVGMGEVGMEITHIYDNHGNHWNRRLEETEKAFEDRATSESQRKGNKVDVLFGEIARVGHWRDTSAQMAETIEST